VPIYVEKHHSRFGRRLSDKLVVSRRDGGILHRRRFQGVRATTACDLAAMLARAVGEFDTAEPLSDSLDEKRE
jgi:hypothetical protein